MIHALKDEIESADAPSAIPPKVFDGRQATVFTDAASDRNEMEAADCISGSPGGSLRIIPRVALAFRSQRT
jgi:hypothetical protein